MNEVEFPDAGGDHQIDGGLSDLTMLGIRGITACVHKMVLITSFSRHFVEQGVGVKLTWGGTGSSPFYGDLVYYLISKPGIKRRSN